MVKVETIRSGLIELRNSQEIQTVLKAEADRIASSCDGDYDTDVRAGKTRANASIVTRDRKTFFKNLKDNELLKHLKG